MSRVIISPMEGNGHILTIAELAKRQEVSEEALLKLGLQPNIHGISVPTAAIAELKKLANLDFDMPASDSAPRPPPADRLATTCLDTIKARPVRWLVPNMVPLGKLVAFVGDGARGKSTITLQMAADLSCGRAMLGMDYAAIQGETLLVSCEDDFEDTVVPRLLAMGADTSKIHRVDGIALAGGKKERFTLAAYEAVKAELRINPNIRLVIVDPAGAYIGNKDDHKDSELRQLLGPLSDVAAECRITIILVKHLNKSASTQAVQRVTGSVAWVNAVRAVYVFALDPDDDELTVMALAKGNLASKATSRGFRRQALASDVVELVLLHPQVADLSAEDKQELAKQLFAPVWQGEVELTADELLANRKKDNATRIEQAMEWIKTTMGDYAWPSDELLAAAKAAKYTFDQVKEARARLKPEGYVASNKGRFRGTWWFGKGDPDTWKQRHPSPASPASPQTPASPASEETPENIQRRERGERGECGEEEGAEAGSGNDTWEVK